MTDFHRGDLVALDDGERWTVAATLVPGDDEVSLCRTGADWLPLAETARVPATRLRLVQAAILRTQGKGADIDYILREDRRRASRAAAGDPTDPTVVRASGVTDLGNVPFDVPVITEIVPGLWQGGCQSGLVLPASISHLVSLYQGESFTVRHALASTRSVRMLDSTTQDVGGVDAIAMWVNECRASGPVLVHCQSGLNRSGLIVARALTLDGMPPADAVALIRERRSPACLSNPAFLGWVLGCGNTATERSRP